MSVKDRILERMQTMGITPKRALGQNFLLNQRVIQKIIEATLEAPAAQILEVGPGLGALTEGLIERGCKLTLIELDSALADYWRARDQEVVEGDALKLDWNQIVGSDAVLVSNLPYQIASGLVIERALGPPSIKRMVLMFQREVAERIQARPRTEDYGLLSVISQFQFKIQKLADLRPEDFHPRPRVASRVLVFDRRQDRQLTPGFLRFVKSAFQFRRKFLVKNLKSSIRPAQISRLSEGLTALGKSEKARAEELSVEDFSNLHRVIQDGD